MQIRGPQMRKLRDALSHHFSMRDFDEMLLDMGQDRINENIWNIRENDGMA